MRRAALAVLMVLALAGCATIPTTGRVTEGRTDLSAPPNYYITPLGPTDGATPRDIVSGFVIAQQGSSFTVAREFLTGAFAKDWNPREKVLIHEKPWTPRDTSESTVTLSVPTTGTLDASGVYSPSEQTRTPLQYTLVKVAGQWRISDAPQGIVLPSAFFQTTYQPQILQFFSPDFTRLVPDVRWFPVRAEADAAILRSLLAGQAPQLAGGATASAFPQGTRIASPLETIDDVDYVALDVPGGTPSTATLTRMFQQLIASLQLKSLTQLQLSVNGRMAPAAQLQNPAPDARPAVLTGSRFGLLQSSGLLESALGRRIAALNPTAVTLVARQNWAVVMTATGAQVVQADGDPRVVDARPGLVDPSVDQSGWIYSVPEANPAAVIAVDRNGQRTAFSGAFDGESVSAIEVSRDGTRLLALVTDAEGVSEVIVAGIERDSAGKPTGLTAARYTESLGTRALDATWLRGSEVAVVTSTTSGDEIVALQLGGLPRALGKLSDVVSIVGGNGDSDLRALLSSGDIYVNPRGEAWEPEFARPVDVSVLAVQR